MITAHALTKRYGSATAVDGLTFEVPAGVVTGFLGPNGSGKSTTMRMILGLDAPSSGSALIHGKHFANHMRTDLVLDALRMALGTRRPGADFTLVAHTDAGSRYTSGDYTQELTDAKVLASIGTVGDAYDNSIAESFLDTFKTELINGRVWRTNSQLELAIVEYVAWFNARRLHTSIGDRPPLEHEAEWRAARPESEPFPNPERQLSHDHPANEYDPSEVVCEVR